MGIPCAKKINSIINDYIEQKKNEVKSEAYEKNEDKKEEYTNLETMEDTIPEIQQQIDEIIQSQEMEIEQIKTNNEKIEAEYLSATEVDNIKMQYDNRKWKQINIPDEYKDRYLTMIQNIENRYVIGLRSINEGKRRYI